MGSYWSRPTQTGTTVTLEPAVKRVSTDNVESSEPAEMQNIAKVTETTSPITSDHVEVYVKGQETKKESKKVFLEVSEPPKKVDLMIIKKEDESKELPTELIKELRKEVKDLIQVLTTEEAPKVEEPKVEAPKVEEPKVEEPKVEEPKISQSEDDNVILLSQDELKLRILGMAEEALEVKKEKKQDEVKANFKKTCDELVEKVACFINPTEIVKSYDEDVKPIPREELRNHVIHELENTSSKVNIKITEKAVKEYLKETSKEKVKSPSLEPVKEEILHEAHPYLLEYGTAPIKTNTILIQNNTYIKSIPTVTPVIEPAVEPVVEPVVESVAHNNKSNKKNKKKRD